MNCTFDCAGNLVIKKNSVINSNCRINTRGGVIIGENVSVSNDVIILTADHDMDTPGMNGRQNPVVIEDFVWIGTRAMILPGLKIGRGSVIAAGSVVTKNINPYEVAAGVPAKVIRERLIKDNYTYTASFKRLFQ